MDYGAAYVMWAPFIEGDAEPETGYPKYQTPMSLGPLMEINDNPTFAEAKGYGDNNTQEHAIEFVECAVDLQVTELPEAAGRAILGCAAGTGTSNTGMKHNIEDNPPYGGLAFYTNKLVNGVKGYKGYFYPKLKAKMGANSFKTKEGTISLTGRKLSLLATAPKSGDWLEESPIFATVAEAKAWVDSMVKKSA